MGVEFPASPVFRTHFYCCGLDSIPGWGTVIPKNKGKKEKMGKKPHIVTKEFYDKEN